jgi:hypothetical protein
VGYNANDTDGSGAGGTGTLNQAYAYGQQHGHAGETAPHTVAVLPLSMVSIKYGSGTVKKDSGSTLFGPRGDTGSATVDLTDSAGYVFPSNCMPAAKNESLLNPTIGQVGLCGCFIDALGNVIANSFWDWKSKGGTDTAASSIALKAPPNAAFLSMGINDTVLYDNGGAGFSVTVYMIESFDFTGDQTFLPRFPIGICSPGYLPSQDAGLKAVLFAFAGMFLPVFDYSPNGFQKGYGGQIFPAGAIASGGGQVVPY